MVYISTVYKILFTRPLRFSERSLLHNSGGLRTFLPSELAKNVLVSPLSCEQYFRFSHLHSSVIYMMLSLQQYYKNITELLTLIQIVAIISNNETDPVNSE